MAKPTDFNYFIGNKYNCLTVLMEGERKVTSGGNIKRRLRCQCDCGIIKDYDWQTVINGLSKSCGCHSRRMASKRMKIINKKHGRTLTTEYNTWVSMKKRCLKESNKSYRLYGARGITVCQEWIDSFETFFKDMGPKPSIHHSLDRINNNDGYYKENCRWATKKEQCQNQRTNRNIEYNGETHCVAEWARKLNMSHAKLHYRLFTAKYPIEKAFKI